jgi:hypothetical protein
LVDAVRGGRASEVKLAMVLLGTRLEIVDVLSAWGNQNERSAHGCPHDRDLRCLTINLNGRNLDKGMYSGLDRRINDQLVS